MTPIRISCCIFNSFICRISLRDVIRVKRIIVGGTLVEKIVSKPFLITTLYSRTRDLSSFKNTYVHPRFVRLALNLNLKLSVAQLALSSITQEEFFNSKKIILGI